MDGAGYEPPVGKLKDCDKKRIEKQLYCIIFDCLIIGDLIEDYYHKEGF